MNEEEEYDEFGNLIGGADDLSSNSESDSEENYNQIERNTLDNDLEKHDEEDEVNEDAQLQNNNVDDSSNNQLVVAESLSGYFGSDVDTVVVQQDTEMLDTPVLGPSKSSKDTFAKQASQESTYYDQLAQSVPERFRSISFIGGLHTGKTSLAKLLVGDEFSQFLHPLENKRQISIFMNPGSYLIPNSKGTNYITNIFDTPGHLNFYDEIICGLTASDAVVFVIDIVEGFTSVTRKLLHQVLKCKKKIILVINKIDRLVLELKLPPQDSYQKIKYTIDEINDFISENEFFNDNLIEMDKVVFASTTLECFFTLKSVGQLYGDEEIPLWGDIFYDKENDQFVNNSGNTKFPRSFVSFVLEPIYKMISYTLVSDEEGNPIKSLLWDNFKISLPSKVFEKEIDEILKTVFRSVFKVSSLMDVISKLSSPQIEQSQFLKARLLRIMERDNCSLALVKVDTGCLKVGQKIRVAVTDDEDEQKLQIVQKLYHPNGKMVQSLFAGGIGFVSGIDSIVETEATLLDENSKGELLYPRTSYKQASVLKVAIEPMKPSDLPALVERLRYLSRFYISIVIKVEDSGEHVILGPGELYLDCFLNDVRSTGIKIRVSDPMVKFGETVVATSAAKIWVDSSSKQNKISIIAEPAERNITNALVDGAIDINRPRETIKALKNLGWDALAARSLWGFSSSNILVHDLLEGDITESKESIVQGFKWATNEGPLCSEPIHQTKFRILDAVLANDNIQRSGTQVIPMVRKACYAGMMTAEPRLLEPVYSVYVTCKKVAIEAIGRLLRKRRGDVIRTEPIPATPLFQVIGFIPVIESTGLETDIRLRTEGQAMCFLIFDKWDLVPGDPMDSNAFLPPLKPVPEESISRDFVLKTRKRKGLVGEPSISKYIGEDLHEKLIQNGLIVNK